MRRAAAAAAAAACSAVSFTSHTVFCLPAPCPSLDECRRHAHCFCFLFTHYAIMLEKGRRHACLPPVSLPPASSSVFLMLQQRKKKKTFVEAAFAAPRQLCSAAFLSACLFMVPACLQASHATSRRASLQNAKQNHLATPLGQVFPPRHVTLKLFTCLMDVKLENGCPSFSKEERRERGRHSSEVRGIFTALSPASRASRVFSVSSRRSLLSLSGCRLH